ncbi:MAG: phage tail sheath protein [Desulfobacterales bacterium]|nr:phage tail sheath protein [Desulfobacterales bacterium]
MSGLRFEVRPRVEACHPNRFDIACFVGFVGFRDRGVLPEAATWLKRGGWSAENLLHAPVPVDDWETFDHHFAWESRPFDEAGATRGASYMGASVRSFFAQGGRKCYVVRVGDPWPLMASAGEGDRTARLAALIPGYPSGLSCSPLDRTSWKGIGCLFGLPEVSYLCLPDLPDIVGRREEKIAPLEPTPDPEIFVECSESRKPPPPDHHARLFRAPRCDADGYEQWATALGRISEMLHRWKRDAHLVAPVPMPAHGTELERSLPERLIEHGRSFRPAQPGDLKNGLASSFVQLVYPWVRTPGSDLLPERLECPDGVMAGLLARNTLARGAFRSAANLPLAEVYDAHPYVSAPRMNRPHPVRPKSDACSTLLDRVSLLGRTPDGFRTLSDVTAGADESYRRASVCRLVSVIVRAAGRMGESLVFETSDERLWIRIRERLNRLLLELLEAGALRGATPAEAFRASCGRDVMTQNDIDNGRVIAEVHFNAAPVIEEIRVVMAMDEGGRISLAAENKE